MTDLIWDRAFDLLLKNEGGYVDNEHDAGGKTNYGVTQVTFDTWNRIKNRPMRGVSEISKEEAKELYRELYWLKFKCDKLPDVLSVALFDFCVQSQPPRPTKFLQECLGVTADGIIGKQTIGAANSKPLKPVIEEYFSKRLAYYQSLSSWKYFGKGWTNRVNRTKQFCEELCG